MRALLLLLFCLAHGAHSQKCSNATEFFGAQPCSNATGTCLACPSPNSVAIASNGPSGACACAPGFYATSTTFRCSTNRPPVEDSFACTRCPASIPQSLCEGGTYMAPAATATSLILTSLGGGSQLYVQCSNASSTSALCGGGSFAEKQGYRRVDIDAFLTTVSWRMRHAPSSRCMIYGQRASSLSVCACPSNSLVTYSYAKVKSQPVVPAVGWVWNLDVAPSFSADPTDPSTKYFGYCACAPGYYRANGAFSYGFFEPCLPCEQGFYCPGGSSAQNSGPRFACALGWTTAANASIAASDCRLCVRPSACGAGMYCDEANPLAWNNADRACVVCPAGYTCPLGKGKNACGPGTYQPRPSSDAAQCLACAPGSFAAGNASTSCSLCPPGTFAADNASTSCRPCEAGWFAARSGSATCSPCANGSVFQPLPGQAGCSRCPPGYVNRSGISSAASNTQLEQVCVACPIGKYSASIAAAECVVCPRDSWNGATGAAACTPCGNGRSTLGNASTSESQCICPPTRIQTGTGFCLYPGTCAPNEYISNAACGICPSCPSTGYYIRPEAMCNGFKDFAASPASTCVPCKKEDTCGTSSSQKFSVLFPCKTGAISQDTSVCVDNALYRNPFDAKCKAGSYEDPYSEEGARYAFDAGATRAVLNPNNTLIAELFGSSVRIWASETALQPLARASMLLHLYPEVAGVYPTRFMLSLDTGDGRTSPALAGPDVLGIDNSTARMPVPDTTRLLSSAVWSADGNILFVVWMDGTISKIVAMPKVSPLCCIPLLIFLAV